MFICESGLGLGTVKSRENLLTSLVTVIFSGYSSALPRLTGGSLASTAAARSTSARRTDPGTARSSPSTKMVKTMKLINCSTFYPHFRFCFRNHYREERPGLWQQERPVARLLGGELRGGRDHHGEWRGHAENIFYELNIFSIFRHVHLVIFIMFIRIVEILLEFVTLEDLIPISFDHSGRVSDKVKLSPCLICWPSQACAPRYIWYSRNLMRREPIGTCFTAKNNFADIFEYSPCKTSKSILGRRFSVESLDLDCGCGCNIDPFQTRLTKGRSCAAMNPHTLTHWPRCPQDLQLDLVILRTLPTPPTPTTYHSVIRIILTTSPPLPSIQQLQE